MNLDETKLELLSPHDWSQEIAMIPLESYLSQGSQLFRFVSKNKTYEHDKDAKAFVNKYLKVAKVFQSDAEVIRYASDQVTLKGAYLEMGVCTGKSINFIAALNSHQIIHGFDSFEGLPEDWERRDRIWPKGTFALNNPEKLPYVLSNVRLYKGLFKDSLPIFKDSILKDTPIAFLNIDCDLYSSTKEVLDILGNNLVSGSIIVFDELYNYPGSEAHEWKALQGFLDEKQIKIEFLAFNENHEQVAVKIL